MARSKATAPPGEDSEGLKVEVWEELAAGPAIEPEPEPEPPVEAAAAPAPASRPAQFAYVGPSAKGGAGALLRSGQVLKGDKAALLAFYGFEPGGDAAALLVPVAGLVEAQAALAARSGPLWAAYTRMKEARLNA